MYVHLEVQTHRSGTTACGVQSAGNPLKSGLRLSGFSPSLYYTPATPVAFCSSDTPKLFLPQDICIPLPTAWTALPSLRSHHPSHNSDFSLNVTSSKRPSLPLQSEVELPNHYQSCPV